MGVTDETDSAHLTIEDISEFIATALDGKENGPSRPTRQGEPAAMGRDELAPEPVAECCVERCETCETNLSKVNSCQAANQQVDS